MMADPRRVWTATKLRLAADLPVAKHLYELHAQQLVTVAQPEEARTYAAPGGTVSYRLTAKGRAVLGEVLERLVPRMNRTQHLRARKLARQIIDALPEEIADRLIDNGTNVIHMIADGGQPFAMIIVPR